MDLVWNNLVCNALIWLSVKDTWARW